MLRKLAISSRISVVIHIYWCLYLQQYVLLIIPDYLSVCVSCLWCTAWKLKIYEYIIIVQYYQKVHITN